MKQLIERLASVVAPSGAERDLQQILLQEVADVADDTLVDTLGNGIAIKNGDGPHVMLTAHADEVGVMVIHIEDSGFLRLIGVGGVNPVSLIGRHVAFTGGITGVVGVESGIKLADVTFDHLFMDIAATSYDEASSKVRIGDSGVILEPVVEIGDGVLAGRALDNRVGCAIAIEAFRALAAKGRRVTVVFTAQQAVGARGAKTAAFQIQPDLALVIDAVPTGDEPEATRMSIQLGGGPAIKIMDATAIVPTNVKNHLIDAAKSQDISVQYEVWPRGQSDAGAIHLSVDGIPVGGISYPARYVGQPSTVVNLKDVAAAVKLVIAAVLQFEK